MTNDPEKTNEEMAMTPEETRAAREEIQDSDSDPSISSAPKEEESTIPKGLIVGALLGSVLGPAGMAVGALLGAATVAEKKHDEEKKHDDSEEEDKK
jgi:hypothetical protein